jgi:hypothetical protein
MDKLDKQFGEMMKGMKNESPSSDFTLKVMSRVYAEAAVQSKPVLQNYTPVISKRVWMILITLFALLIFYFLAFGQNASEWGKGLFFNIFGSVETIKSPEASTVLNKGMDLFKSVPSIAYLILIASLALWIIDSFFTNLRHRGSKLSIR